MCRITDNASAQHAHFGRIGRRPDRAGIPAAGNVHEVAAQVTPGTRVAYIDNDPIVHVHANALLTGSGTTSIVLADLCEPEAIVAHPKVRALIDFTQPVALLLVAILHFITEKENPARILSVFRDALPAVISSPRRAVFNV